MHTAKGKNLHAYTENMSMNVDMSGLFEKKPNVTLNHI